MVDRLGSIVGEIAGKPIQANQITRKGGRWGSGRMTPSDGQDTATNGIARRLTPTAKSIVIYWSRSGSTELLASKIAAITNSDVLQITLKVPYPADYLETRTRANRERESGVTPKLNMDLPNLRQYNTVYLGFQTWAMTLSEPIKAFLKVDGGYFTNKQISPCETQGGYGIGDGLQLMVDLLHQSGASNFTIDRPLIIDGNKVDMAEEEVKSWLQNTND